MTRLTNAFSEKWEHMQAAYYLWFAFASRLLQDSQSLARDACYEENVLTADHTWNLQELLS